MPWVLRGVYVPDVITILASLYFILGDIDQMSVMFAVDLPYWAQSLLRVLGGTVAVLLPAGTIVYLFLFKMMSFMQSRLGPMEAGPYGSMQLFAEVGKWLQKEDIQPEKADKRIFKMAPLIVLVSTFLLVAVVPFGPDAYFTDFDAGVFYMLAVSIDQRARHPDRRLEQRQQVLAARRPARRRPADRLRAADGAGRARRRHPGRHDEHAGHRRAARTPARSSAGTASATRTSSPSSSASWSS